MNHEKLHSYQALLKLAGELSKEVAKWRKGYGYLSDQLKRAMASVVLNLAEGNARRSQTERRRFFEIARASAAEVGACVDLMRVFGLTQPERTKFYKSRLVPLHLTTSPGLTTFFICSPNFWCFSTCRRYDSRFFTELSLDFMERRTQKILCIFSFKGAAWRKDGK